MGTSGALGYAWATLLVVIATGVAWLAKPVFGVAETIMTYLLAVLIASIRLSRGPAIVASVLSVAAFDFFFIEPYFTLTVADPAFFVTFAVMLITGLAVNTLTLRVRAEATARARLAQEALQAQVDAEAERTRSTLLSAISHDIRTPLASIAGAASVLEDRAAHLDAPERQELVASIREEAERLSRLVNDLLELTRLKSGKVSIAKVWVPLEEVITSALARTPDAPTRERVVFALPETILLVQADPVLLEQVFVNLFDNARKYAASGPVDVNAWTEHDEVVVTVEDRGPGIARELEERVFEGFFHSGPAAGAGLGLAVCRAIVLAHGGVITARARPGGGASFRIALPLGGKPPSISAEAP